MFTIVEIDKTGPFLGSFTPYAPFVYSSILTVGGTYSIDPYWTSTFGANGDYNTAEKNVTSVVLNNIFDVEGVDTLADCLTQINSFYFDFDNQVLYVHFPHVWTPQAVGVATGQGWGYCSDTVRYFRNQIYRPIVRSIPILGDSTDPLQYGIIAFAGGQVTLVNDGSFDKDEKLYGNNIRIKRGKEGDDYDDLILMFSGYIRDYTTTTAEFTIDVADKRERLQTNHPSQEIEVLDKYIEGEGWEKKSQLLADGYGQVVQVPAYPIATGGGKVTFRWGESVTSISQVYTEEDTVKKVAHADFSTDGTFTLTNAQAGKDSDPTKGILKVFVSGVMRNIANPADIIIDLNSRLFEVDYNASNYDIAEVEAEKALLADVGLYMDKSRKVYEWIEELQNGTNIGFRYEDTEKRTIRLDLPTRPVVVDIEALDIRNADMPIQRNAELYASSCLVRYSKNWRSDSYQSTENKDWEGEVIDEHRVKKVQEYDSLLTSLNDAEDKALTVMADIHQVRPIVTLRVESSLYPTPRIFDMVTATVSLVQGVGPMADEWTFVVGDLDLLGDDLLVGEIHEFTLDEVATYNDSVREYLGAITGQVIGINWLIDTDEIELRVRVRNG